MARDSLGGDGFPTGGSAGGDGVDEAALERMQTVASVLDESIPIPGIGYRIGLDPLVGVLPVAGDVVTGLCSLYILVEAGRLGVSRGTLAKMFGNVAVDAVAGSVPLIGDLFDSVWKANLRNVRLAMADLDVDPERIDAAF